ncbi:MAG: Adaptive-response sensory-kinase SasA [Syntrophus sp. SKADARSKE-3]|nr:Adaptive-response sensory-kinase SasA [Syntrophus sp. SKADARSKE-3]
MTKPLQQKGRSIKSRLILLILSILIPNLAIQAYIHYDSYKTQRDNALRDNLESARAVAKAFESFVNDILHQELTIGLVITSSQPSTQRDISRLLKTSRYNAALRDFSWLDAKGKVIYSSNPGMIGVDYGDRSYVPEIIDGREWVVSELVIAKTTGKPVFGISRGVRDSKGHLLGIVMASVIPEKLGSTLSIKRSKGGGHALVDSKGMLVYRYPVISTTWEERNWLKPFPEFGEALKGKEVTKVVYAPFENKTRFVGFVPVPFIGWAASAGTREDDLTGPIISSVLNSALLFLTISLAAFLVAIAVSRRITGPVRKLRAHALAIGNGEMHRQEMTNPVSEFQELAEAFNTMADKVQAREADLRKSEERLKLVMNTVPALISYIDKEFRYQRVNEGYRHWFGLSPYDMKGRHVQDVMGDEVWRVVQPYLQRAMDGETVKYEEHIFYKTGGPRWISSTLVPDRDATGSVAGLVALVMDISEHKQIEDELNKKTLELQSLFNNTNAGLVLFDAESPYTVLAHNKYYQELFAEPFRSSGMVGKNLYEYAPAVEAQGITAVFDEVVRTGNAINYTDFPYDINPLHKSWFNWHLSPIIRDGKVIALASMSLNVTDHHEAVQALKENEDRLRTLYSTMNEGLAIHEIVYENERAVDYIITDVNPAYERITALTKDSTIGRRASELYGTSEAPYLEIYTKVASTGEPYYFETYFPPMKKHFAISVFSPGTGKFATVFQDITKCKTAEEALKERTASLEERTHQFEDAIQELEGFSYSVSHDLKAPLRAIDGFSKSLLKKYGDHIDEDATRRLNVIRENTQMMGALIEDLLSFSQLSRTRVDAKEFDLAALASSVWKGIMEDNPNRSIEITIHDLPPVFGDSSLIRQVLVNLFSNAVKFTKERSRAAIELSGRDSGNGDVIYTVKDNGIGFDMQYHDKLFGVFERLHPEEYEGTGVGLAIVQRIINRHGGHIWAESAEGGGSAFHFSLPAKASSD